MSMTVTLALLAVSVAMTALSAWRGGLPPDIIRGPRMIPWRFLMILFAALAMLLVIHVAALLGAPMRA